MRWCPLHWNSLAATSRRYPDLRYTFAALNLTNRVFFRLATVGEERYAVQAVEDVKHLLDVPAEQRPRTSNTIVDGALGQLVSVATKHDVLQYVTTERRRCSLLTRIHRLPPQLQDSLRGLYEHLVAVYSTRLLRAFPGDENLAQSTDSSLTILRMWSHTLWLGRWAGTDSMCACGFILLILL